MKLIKVSIMVFLVIIVTQVIGCSNNNSDLELDKKVNKEEKTIVSENGYLRTDGNKIVNKHGDNISLYGMSLFWSQWGGKYYNADCVKYLKDNWKCNILRAAMGIEGGGYLENKEVEKNKITTVVDACINEGIYVIIDWHDHHAEKHLDEAKLFFGEMAKKYNGTDNIIYEIYNEPLQISWTSVIKPYAEEVISEIRKYDNQNLIVVGTPNWSQLVDSAAANPIDDSNVAYSLHYYTSTHSQWLRDTAARALELGAPLFVTEFGISEANGDGKINYEETEKWIQFAEENNLSCCNWSIIDKDETSAALLNGANPSGKWTDDEISESGKFIKSLIIKHNSK